MMKKIFFTLISISITAFFLFSSCSNRLISVNKTKIALGTYVQINIVTAKGEEKETDNLIERAFNLVQKYDRMFDYRSESGDLYRFNEQNYIQKSNSPVLFSLILESIEIAKLTYGYFDPTMLPLVRVWGFDNENPHLPPSHELKNALERVGFEKLKIMEESITKPEQVKLDLSGIAKGKIVDLLSDFLTEQGVNNFLINAGGDIYIKGKNSSRKKWRIAIQDPDNHDQYVGIIEKSNTAVVTSGDYERFFWESGKRYSHLLNPKTGYPDSDIRSVTVLASEATFADAIATAVFVMGNERGYNFMVEKGIEGFIIYNSKQGKTKKRSTPGFWD